MRRIESVIARRGYLGKAALVGAFSVALIASATMAQTSTAPTGQAAASSTPPVAEPHAHDNGYVIGAEDKLSISVWKEADLTRSVPVRSDGKISLPLVGEVQAAGKTPMQLEGELASKLSNFITEPSVTVIVEQVNSKKFNILGQVVRPGSYPLAAAPTIVDAIAAAGGFRDFAKQKGVYILRKQANGADQRIPFNYKNFIHGKDLTQNVRLEPGDTIIVP